MRSSWWETDSVGVAWTAVQAHGALQKHAELARFIELVTKLDPLEVIVEIGSYEGGTLWAWTQLAPTVIGVDLPRGPYDTFARSGGPMVNHGAHMVFGDSHDPLTLESLKGVLNHRPVDMLFIDGDHTFEGVSMDYAMYAPLVRPGGVVAFHDIVPHEGAEVARWWATVEADKQEIVDTEQAPEVWGGIGVLVV
jgi:cephalosporin hydroxylase